jgi:hypothetical protein
MRTYEQLQQATRNETAVSVSTLQTDGGTQYRSQTDQDTVEQYKQCMQDGDAFPPIDTVFDGRDHWVYDGFHRLAALYLLGAPIVSVRFIEGTQSDAQFLALTANAKHGLVRDMATKKKIGLAAISNPLLSGCKPVELSKITGLSLPFILSLIDPEIKVKQQEARDRSALKRINQKVMDPNTTSEDAKAGVGASPVESLDPSQAINPINDDIKIPEGDFGPSEEELEANELALKEDMAIMYRLLESDEPLKLAHKEITRVNHLNGMYAVRIHALMNEKNEIIKEVKRAQGRCKKLEKELRGYRMTKSEIKIEAEAQGRAELVDSFRYLRG